MSNKNVITYQSSEHPNVPELLEKVEKGHLAACATLQELYNAETDPVKIAILETALSQVTDEREAAVVLARIVNVEFATINKMTHDAEARKEAEDKRRTISENRQREREGQRIRNARNDEAARRVGYGRGMPR